MSNFKQQQLEILKNLGDVMNFSYDLQRINYLAKKSPKKLVKVAEQFYDWQIDEICQNFVRGKHKILFVAGPSSAGKTTTCKKLVQKLQKHKITAKVISLDDFFLDKANRPRLQDGSVDFESLGALDLKYMDKFMKTVCAGKEGLLPQYDFVKGQRDKLVPFRLEKNEALIVEGLHALNPMLHKNLKKGMAYNVFISVASCFTLGDDVVIKPEQIRLLRRMLRDHYNRATSPVQTLQIWKNVRSGERQYIIPYRESADYLLNTTHLYEPLLFDKYLGRILACKNAGSDLDEVKKIFLHTGSMDKKLVPKNSLLWEFLPADGE